MEKITSIKKVNKSVWDNESLPYILLGVMVALLIGYSVMIAVALNDIKNTLDKQQSIHYTRK